MTFEKENIALLLLMQEMELFSSQQIEEELRRALNLNQDQPAVNSRQSKSSSSVSSTTAMPGASVRPASVGSSSSPASAAEKIPKGSSSTPSVNDSKQASFVCEAGGSRRRKTGAKQRKKNSPRPTPHDAVVTAGLPGNEKNISQSQKSTLAVEPHSTTEVTNTVSGDIASTSAVHAHVATTCSSSSKVAGSDSATGSITRTTTVQRGGRVSRGQGYTKALVPDQPLQKPKSENHTGNVTAKPNVASSGQLLATNTRVVVKTVSVSTAENVTDQSKEAAAKILQNSVKPPVKKHDKGRISYT